MKRIFIYSFSLVACLMLAEPLRGQDTLRTYGPRFGIDLARFIYYFTDPAETGAAFSADLEVYDNFFAVIEAGYSTLSDSLDQAAYKSSGTYARIGLDYNVLPVTDRSVHHSITVGLRYATSRFTHSAQNIVVPSAFWGDYLISNYEHTLNGHWIEITGGITAELLPNFFMGWSLRYKRLLNPGLDPQIAPLLIPGYGRGSENQALGFTYSVFYKIPLWKK